MPGPGRHRTCLGLQAAVPRAPLACRARAQQLAQATHQTHICALQPFQGLLAHSLSGKRFLCLDIQMLGGCLL